MDSYIKGDENLDGSQLRGPLTDIKEMEQNKEASQNYNDGTEGSFQGYKNDGGTSSRKSGARKKSGKND